MAVSRAARFPVAIIGPGALGLVFASRLSSVVPTAVIAKSAERAAELRRGVLVAGKRRSFEAYGAKRPPRADWILVLVKAHQTLAAARIAARMAPKGVLSLQNGLVENELKKPLRGLRAAQGVTTEGAYRDGRRVVHAASGETLLPPGFAALNGYLARAGFGVRVTRELPRARLRKLLISACINPVAALFRLRNAETLKVPYARFTETLASEAAPVLAAEGLHMSAAQCRETVRRVAQATARNRCSMLQDVLAGRETEIEQITGALLRLARRHRIAAPTHVAFYRLIRLAAPR